MSKDFRGADVDDHYN